MLPSSPSTQFSPPFVSHDVPAMTGALVAGLAAFCLVFAVNSSVHSYLIVRYADGDKVRGCWVGKAAVQYSLT
jgi:hypothetical protein